MSRKPGAEIFVVPEPLELELGGSLHDVEVAYETWGRLDPVRGNAILICPAFSAHSHANSGPQDPSSGWWEGMVGPGLAFDTNRFFVICPSLLGGSYGTTGPSSVNPDTGEPYAGSFPLITVRDIVTLHIRLLDHLGIERLYAAAGGSLGGMETLELGVRHHGRVSRVVSISGTATTRPYTAAIRHLARRAILLDPEYHNGFYEGDGPVEGLKLARELGIVFYRSREELNERFPWTPIHEPSLGGVTFDVQSYLRHQGRKIVGSFDANSYLTLSLAMDLHDVYRGESREEALRGLDAEFSIVGIEEDRLIPIDEQKDVYEALVAAGVESRWRGVSSHIGHDAFLVELDAMTALLREFLE